MLTLGSATEPKVFDLGLLYASKGYYAVWFVSAALLYQVTTVLRPPWGSGGTSKAYEDFVKKVSSVLKRVEQTCSLEHQDCKDGELIAGADYLIFLELIDTENAQEVIRNIRLRQDGELVVLVGVTRNELRRTKWFLMAAKSFLGDMGLNRIVAADDIRSEREAELLILELLNVDVPKSVKFRAVKGALKALDLCSSPVEITDNNHRIQFVNVACEKHLNRRRSEVIGKDSSEIQEESRGSLDLDCCDGHSEIDRWVLYPFTKKGESPALGQVIHVQNKSWYGHPEDNFEPEPRYILRTAGPPINRILHTLRFIQTLCIDNKTVAPLLQEVVDILSTKHIYKARTSIPAEVCASPAAQQVFKFYAGAGAPDWSHEQRESFDEHMKRRSDPRMLERKPSVTSQEKVDKELDRKTQWTCNVLTVERIYGQERVLQEVGRVIFAHFKVGTILKLPEQSSEKLINCWLELMAASYLKNPYHNSTHAADVLQAVAYFLELPEIRKRLDSLEAASALVAAVMHDCGHLGRSSSFLISSNHDWAIKYNDISVCENHHAAYAWELTLAHDESNIFRFLDRRSLRQFRKKVIGMILATDMFKHLYHVQLFEQILPTLRSETCEDFSNLRTDQDLDSSQVLLNMIIKAADISNPARQWEQCFEWANRISQEYISQTEEEKERGLPVSFPMYSHDCCKQPQLQVTFITQFVKWTFELMSHLVPSMSKKNKNGPCYLLDQNMREWMVRQEMEDEETIDSETGLDSE